MTVLLLRDQQSVLSTTAPTISCACSQTPPPRNLVHKSIKQHLHSTLSRAQCPANNHVIQSEITRYIKLVDSALFSESAMQMRTSPRPHSLRIDPCLLDSFARTGVSCVQIQTHRNTDTQIWIQTYVDLNTCTEREREGESVGRASNTLPDTPRRVLDYPPHHFRPFLAVPMTVLHGVAVETACAANACEATSPECDSPPALAAT
jgi:hypothetical protein